MQIELIEIKLFLHAVVHQSHMKLCLELIRVSLSDQISKGNCMGCDQIRQMSQHL